MPTSVKDRFNQAGEYLFHFVKQKKYYFDLDAVRIKSSEPNAFRPRMGQLQDGPTIYERKRPTGIDREKDYPNAKRNANAFNYRVRDAVKKEGQPQFVASEEEVKNYQGKFLRNKDFETYNSPRARTQRKYKAPVGPKMGKDNDRQEWSSQTPNWQNENGKNIPNAWLIGTEPQKDAHFAMYPTALCEIPILSSCPKDGIVFDPFMGGGSTAVTAQRLGRKYVGVEINSAYIKIAEKRLRQNILL